MQATAWIQKLLRKQAEIDLGSNAVLLDDQQKLLRYTRQTAAAVQRKFLGNDMPEPEADEDDTMGVQVGDNHIYPAAAPKRPGLNPIVGALIGAGLMATGVGGYHGLALVADSLRNMKPSTTVTMPGDGNTHYRLELLD